MKKAKKAVGGAKVTKGKLRIGSSGIMPKKGKKTIKGAKKK